MLYSSELIEEIRIQNDIVDVISEYVPLKQKGSSYFGLCPFHHENSPSFSVSPDKQLYYCFGCGAAGNVYSFIMQIENCTFPEAIQKLADRVHIQLPEPQYSKEAQEAEDLKQTLYQIHKMAGRFYYHCLQSSSGTKARQYIENRKIDPAIQKKFGLGFSPDGYDQLYLFLKEKGFQDNDIVKSGLVLPNKNGTGYHDRFRGRVMFPIFDIQGRCIGFGGRIMDHGEPKYLNSPETPIFNKSRNLYGLNFARAARRKELIIVEGYMDMITIFQAGFHNVAASLGTAFNAEHAKTLKKFATDIILLFDSDEAGTNAALRAIPVLVSGGFSVKVLQVPGGTDPDEFIKTKGSSEFAKLLVNAESYIQFRIRCIGKKYHVDNPEQKVLYTKEAAAVLSELENEIERDVYVKEVAAFTGISEEAIRREILGNRKKEEIKFAQEADRKRIRKYNQTSAAEETRKSRGILEAQRNILYLCATNFNVYKKVRTILMPKDYIDPDYQKLASLLYEACEKGNSIFPAEAVNFFDSVEAQKKVSEVFTVKNEFGTLRELEKAVNEEVALIKRAKIDQDAAKAQSIEDIKSLLELKRELSQLNIKLSDG